jgi:hypothetical protein
MGHLLTFKRTAPFFAPHSLPTVICSCQSLQQ